MRSAQNFLIFLYDYALYGLMMGILESLRCWLVTFCNDIFDAMDNQEYVYISEYRLFLVLNEIESTFVVIVLLTLDAHLFQFF
jgi:hypothetical protein